MLGIVETGRNGNGNRNGIGIEICYSKSGGERFNKAEDLAAEYIAYLLKQYGWGIDKVKKHQDFMNKYCPHRTLDLGWDRFLNKVQNNLNGQNYTPQQNVETSTDRIKELQKALNADFNCNLDVDGMIGPLTTNAVMKHYLKYFTKGNFVKWVQTQLQRKGYNLGSYGIDSSYGHDMEKAVLQFQKDYNLTQDKCVGIQVVKNLVN